ncbi:MAG: glycosyltransferase [Planctomycetia bacterium]|nr:glycosyltransferase [Planctomycetia bacterium]
MTAQPRFSVVTIVRDGETHLAEAVASVRDQSVEDWELHIVDDGSIDGTLDLATRLAEEDSERIHVHRHPQGENRGMSASRNLGLRHATGEFVTWLDHDDRFLPRKLETLHETLDRCPEAVAAIGPCRRWWSWGSPEGRDEDQTIPSVEADRLLRPPGLLPMFLENPRAVPLAPLVRRRPLVAMGGHVERFRGMYEDQAFLARLMFRHPVIVIPDVLHLYRQHESSCVARTHRSGLDIRTRRRFLHWLAMEFETCGPRDETLRRAIARATRATRSWRLRRWQRIIINLRSKNVAH